MNHGMASIAAAVALSLGSSAWSASLHVSPVSLKLDAGQQAAGITLSNPGDHPLVAQVRVFAWAQDVGDDYLLEQKDMVASPPIVTIPAQGEQLVRIVRLDHVRPARELTYRLLVDELPDPANVATDGAVNIRIRYSVPLFVPSNAQSIPALHWELNRRDGTWFMKVANSGGTHAQLSAVKLVKPDGSSFSVTDGLLGYALAGGAREWRIPIRDVDAVRPLRINAMVNGNPADSTISTAVNPASFARQ
jgi:fimbrial chaperone protein